MEIIEIVHNRKKIQENFTLSEKDLTMMNNKNSNCSN